MIFAKLNASGLLSDIRSGPQQPGGLWPDGSQDVPLAAMPTDPIGTQYTYDAVNQLAVPVPARKPRTMWAVASDIFALTGSLPTPAAGTQKANIIADLFSGNLATGSQKWQQDTGPNLVAMSAVYAAITASNGLATFNAAQQMILAAMYCIDNPNYLVNPSFDSSINVPGDQLA